MGAMGRCGGQVLLKAWGYSRVGVWVILPIATWEPFELE